MALNEQYIMFQSSKFLLLQRLMVKSMQFISFRRNHVRVLQVTLVATELLPREALAWSLNKGGLQI